MLTSLFKPAWQSRSTEKRLKAVTTMDHTRPEKQQILAQLATDDENISIRLAAIQKITSVSVLSAILQNHSSKPTHIEAEKRLEELITTNLSLDENQYHDLLHHCPQLAGHIATHVKLASVRISAIKILPPDKLLAILEQSIYTDTRQCIADQLAYSETDIKILESARKILHGKDKKAERILRHKIDDCKKWTRQQAENLTCTQKLTEEIEFMASRDWRPEFKAKLIFNRQQWGKLDFDIDQQLLQRYRTARSMVDARFEQQCIIEQTHQSQQQLITDTEIFLQTIAAQTITELASTQAAILARQTQLHTNWQQLAEKNQPDISMQNNVERIFTALQSVYQLLSHAADVLQSSNTTEANHLNTDRQNSEQDQLAENCKKLKTTLEKFNWPDEYGELQAATELQTQLTAWQKQLKASIDEQKHSIDRLHKKISSVFRFSRSGNLPAAKQFCEKVEKGIQKIEGKDRQLLEQRFEEARKTLENMDDWKNFATEPKYIELCETMEQLGKAAYHPDKLSVEIKKLQQRWKKLGHSDISEHYWPRFKQAADTAYQPCAVFFEKRHQTRQQNLNQRQQYVEQMQKLLEETDWTNQPDYKATQSAMRSINDKFTRIKEVEHKAGQKQWKQFSALRDQLTAKLDVAYDENIALKHQLIQYAQALAEVPARDENLIKLKSLQARWKNTGITRRHEDQQAWTQFKKYSDIVYSNIQQLRQQHKQETDQQLNAYQNIIKAIEKLASTAKDLTEADQLFATLQSSYAELPELPALPEKLLAGIKRDYQHACDKFDQRHTQIISNRHNRQIKALHQKADLCAQLEALGKTSAGESIQAIEQQWNAIDLHDSTLSHRIEKRRQTAHMEIDRTAISQQRRLLCIQLEITAGIESPEEDKTMRMKYQLEQMNKSGLGHQLINSIQQLEALEIDWLCMPGAETSQQKKFDQRFQQALGRAKNSQYKAE